MNTNMGKTRNRSLSLDKKPKGQFFFSLRHFKYLLKQLLFPFMKTNSVYWGIESMTEVWIEFTISLYTMKQWVFCV